ncbi:hypothetical protein PAMP_022974 [Pampus punctatissimus]
MTGEDSEGRGSLDAGEKKGRCRMSSAVPPEPFNNPKAICRDFSSTHLQVQHLTDPITIAVNPLFPQLQHSPKSKTTWRSTSRSENPCKDRKKWMKEKVGKISELKATKEEHHHQIHSDPRWEDSLQEMEKLQTSRTNYPLRNSQTKLTGSQQLSKEGQRKISPRAKWHSIQVTHSTHGNITPIAYVAISHQCRSAAVGAKVNFTCIAASCQRLLHAFLFTMYMKLPPLVMYSTPCCRVYAAPAFTQLSGSHLMKRFLPIRPALNPPIIARRSGNSVARHPVEIIQYRQRVFLAVSKGLPTGEFSM